MQVSHETIYKRLFIQARGVLKINSGPSAQPSDHAARQNLQHGRSNRGQIIDTVSIRDRPAEIEYRAIPGQWEGDLLSGAKNTHIATLVERTSLTVCHAGSIRG